VVEAATQEVEVQCGQLGGRVGAELVGERVAGAGVDGERVGGAAGECERTHQQRGEPFPQRVFGQQ
jgi:hypothetical protein